MLSEPDKKNWIVCYYGQTFALTDSQRVALLKARADGLDMVQIDELTLSTTFSWVAPVYEVEAERLSIEEVEWIKRVAKWLAKPVHDLGWDYEMASRYAKKLVKRVGAGQTKELWDKYAEGAYPSARKFLSEAKQLGIGADSEIGKLPETVASDTT